MDVKQDDGNHVSLRKIQKLGFPARDNFCIKAWSRLALMAVCLTPELPAVFSTETCMGQYMVYQGQIQISKALVNPVNTRHPLKSIYPSQSQPSWNRNLTA